jgi:hypothetical protein
MDTRPLFFHSTLLKHSHHFDYFKPASEHAHVHLLPRLSWSCYLIHTENLLHPLLPFVTYLLTLPHINCILQKLRTSDGWTRWHSPLKVMRANTMRMAAWTALLRKLLSMNLHLVLKDFMAYWTMQSVAQTVLYQMTKSSAHDKLKAMWKEVVIT